MEEEQRLRGRLSRRRPPAGGGVSNCRPWFLLEGRKSEPWAALLRSTVSGNVDLTPNSQPLPPLPAFPSQESLPDPEPTVAPEVFTVGSETFSWTPFPPALVSENSNRLFQGTGGSLGSPTPSLRGCPAPDANQTPSTQECVSVQSPPVLLSCPLCQKAFDPMKAVCLCCPCMSTLSKKRLLNLEEGTSVHWVPFKWLYEGLAQCLDFPKVVSARLSQLDVDSHLAQCLAESTEDVMW